MTTSLSGPDPISVPRSTVSTSADTRFKLAAFLIVLISVLIYLPVIHGAAIWDDKEIMLGRGIGKATTVFQCFTHPFLYHYYRPLTSVTFLVEHRIWGNNTFGYHLTSIVLHSLTTAVCIPMLWIAFRNRRVALLGAMLFAVQPIQVSTTAWIGGRTDCLCTLFVALFCWAVVSAANCDRPTRNMKMCLSVVFYALAVLSKEQAIALLPLGPLALIALGRLRSPDSEPVTQLPSPGSSEIKAITKSELVFWPAVYLVIAACLMALWRIYGNPVHAPYHIIDQLRLVGRTVTYYVAAFLIPTPTLLHTLTLGVFNGFAPVANAVGLALVVSAVVVGIKWMRTAPMAAWYLCACALLIAPVSNIYPLVTQTVAPYRAGTAGLPAAGLLAWVLIVVLDRFKSGVSRSAYLAACSIYVVWLTGLTAWGVTIWQDELKASMAIEKYCPDTFYGILQTASAYLDRGKVVPALERIDAIAAALPDQLKRKHQNSALSWMSRTYLPEWVGELYGSAGTLRLKAGNRSEAFTLLTKAVKLSPKNEIVNTGLANYYLAINDLDSAEMPIRAVLRKAPELTNQRYVLGRILLKQKRWKEAAAEFTRCMEQNPKVPDLYILRAFSNISDGDRPAADQVLTLGLSRKVLDSAKVDEWLKSISQPPMVQH